MAFVRAILSAIRNSFNFSGRANRREFWFWLIFVVAGYLLTLYLDLTYMGPYFGYLPMEEGAPQPLHWIWLALCAIPTLSLIFRRVQDHDKPGYMALTVVPLAWWLIAKGTKGPNRYG